jgi:SAM-dependent methyltransferase
VNDAETSWSERAYADARSYLAHRAGVVTHLGPELVPGDTLLDLACGDAAFADFLPTGVRYLGVDGSAAMVAAARARGHEAVNADLNDYVPREPVAVTTCFRAVYYACDRRAFFAHVAGYTEKKFVFDLNPRQYELHDVLADLDAVGFTQVSVQPFFSPQRVALPALLRKALYALESAPALARLLLRIRFTYVCAAARRTCSRPGLRALDGRSCVPARASRERTSDRS